MIEENVFEIRLSLGELFWLAHAMNIQHLPLARDPYQGWLADEIQQDLASGCLTLQERGLVMQMADNHWQLDDILYAAVRWIAETRRCLMVRCRKPGGKTFLKGAYRTASGILITEWDERHVRLLLFRDFNQSVRHLLKTMGYPDQPVGKEKPLTLKKASLRCWFETGTYESLPTSIERCIELEMVEWLNDGPRVTRQAILLSAPGESWLADNFTDQDQDIEFSPVTGERMDALLQRWLL